MSRRRTVCTEAGYDVSLFGASPHYDPYADQDFSHLRILMQTHVHENPEKTNQTKLGNLLTVTRTLLFVLSMQDETKGSGLRVQSLIPCPMDTLMSLVSGR
jgi:hypothetical protein